MQKDNEAIIDVYLAKVKESKNHLIEYYSLSILEGNRRLFPSEIKMLWKFINTFGIYRVFYAITEISTIHNIDCAKDCTPLLRWSLNKSLKEELSGNREDIDLSTLLAKKKATKIKVKDID